MKANLKTFSGKQRLERLLNSSETSLEGMKSPKEDEFKKVSFFNTNAGTPNQEIVGDDWKKRTSNGSMFSSNISSKHTFHLDLTKITENSFHQNNQERD